MDRTLLKPLALAVVLMAAASALILFSPSSDADETKYDGTIDLYGYKITMGLIEPNQVSTVEWDFGDGSEHVTVTITADNPVGKVQHTYAEKGDYVVTATMRNQYTDSKTGELKDGESKLTYLYHIYGYPTISYDFNDGTLVRPVEGTASHYVPTKPTDPTRSGYEFTGWYKDEACTQAFDWTSEVTKHVTLYAGWKAVQATEYTSTLKYDANGGTDAPSDDVFVGTSTDAHAFTVASSAPVKEGYRFTGWADAADASEAVYKAGDSVSVAHDGTKTIYAVWSKILSITIVDSPSSAVVGTEVTIRIHVNQYEFECVPSPSDAVADIELTSQSDGSDGYYFDYTFTAVKVGKLSIVFTVQNPGSFGVFQTVGIHILSNGVTAPPSAEGIEATVKE